MVGVLCSCFRFHLWFWFFLLTCQFADVVDGSTTFYVWNTDLKWFDDAKTLGSAMCKNNITSVPWMMYDDVAFWLKIGGKGNSREVLSTPMQLWQLRRFSVCIMPCCGGWSSFCFFAALCWHQICNFIWLQPILPSSYDGLAALVDFIFAFEPSDPPWFIYTLVGIMVLLWVLPSYSRCTKDVAVQTSSDWDSLSSSLPLKVYATAARAGGCYPNEIANMAQLHEGQAQGFIAVQALRGLHHCHEHHILHRGLKPSSMQFEDGKGQAAQISNASMLFFSA